MALAVLTGIPISAGISIGKAFFLNRSRLGQVPRQTIAPIMVPAEIQRLKDAFAAAPGRTGRHPRARPGRTQGPRPDHRFPPDDHERPQAHGCGLEPPGDPAHQRRMGSGKGHRRPGDHLQGLGRPLFPRAPPGRAPGGRSGPDPAPGPEGGLHGHRHPGRAHGLRPDPGRHRGAPGRQDHELHHGHGRQDLPCRHPGQVPGHPGRGGRVRPGGVRPGRQPGHRRPASTARSSWSPTRTSWLRYGDLKYQFESYRAGIIKNCHLPGETIDGYRIKVKANIELYEEVAQVLDQRRRRASACSAPSTPT